MVITMTAGTGVIMWLGELITDRGIGNGMSLLIFTSIAAGFPTALWQIKIAARLGRCSPSSSRAGLVLVALVVFVEQAQRRIPVQYAKRMIGRRMYGGSSTYIPLKVNQAGVIPVIFASSLLYLPSLAVNLADQQNPPGWAQWLQTYLVRGDHPLYMVAVLRPDRLLHVLLRGDHVQPDRGRRQHEEVRRLHPGHPGRPADRRVPRLRPLPDHRCPARSTSALIALIPLIALGLFSANQNFPFGGTAILIIVGVGLETVKQIESQLQQRNYEGFLR